MAGLEFGGFRFLVVPRPSLIRVQGQVMRPGARLDLGQILKEGSALGLLVDSASNAAYRIRSHSMTQPFNGLHRGLMKSPLFTQELVRKPKPESNSKPASAKAFASVSRWLRNFLQSLSAV